MKFKLHNNYEITHNGKVYKAYNTLLSGVYQKIANLEEYTSRIAVGTGTTERTFTDNKLSNYYASFETTTEEISCDPSNSTLYIKKLVNFDQSDTTTFSFCELGLACSNETNCDIFNHVLLKDESGNVVTITKNASDIMQIRVTIFLELENNSQALFTSGDNALIKQILGEKLNLADKNLYAVRGECLAPNVDFDRCLPDLTKAVKCKCTLSQSQNVFSLNFSAKLGVGKTEEILIVFANQVCIRLKTNNSTQAKTKQIQTGSDKVCEVDQDVNTIQAVTSASNQAITNYNLIKYGNKITDKNTNVFDQTFDSNTTRFVAKDGKHILFIKNQTTYLYKYENYNFVRVLSNNLPTSNILNLEIYQNKICCVLTQSPYVRIFDITQNGTIENSISLGYYNMTSYSYDWLKASSIITENQKIIIGLVLNNQSQTPIAIRLTKNSDGVYVDQIVHLEIDHADKIISVLHNAYVESQILFVTSLIENDMAHAMQKVNETSVAYVGGSVPAYGLLEASTEILSGGKILFAQKSTSPYTRVYYLPGYTSAELTFSDGVKHYLSYDGDYLIAKYQDGSYKLFNSHRDKTLTEFNESYKTLINFTNATDFVFVGDLLLVFSSNSTEPLNSFMIKKNLSRIDNVSQENINVTYLQNTYLGEGEDEGVMVTLTLTFGEEE